MGKKGKGTRKRGKGYLSRRDKGLPLNSEETDVTHRKMAVYKGKGRTRVRMRCLILIGQVN